MTKLKIAQKICESMNGSRLYPKFHENEIVKILSLFFEEVKKNMIKGKRLQFREFGSFCPITYKQKVGRNPKKPGTDIVIPPMKKVKFLISKSVKKEMNAK